MAVTSLPVDPEPLSRLIGMGYEATVRFGEVDDRQDEAAAWHAFAAEASRAFGCQLAIIEYHDHQQPQNNFIATGGLDGFEEVFAGARARIDQVEDNFFRGIRDQPAGTVRLGCELVSRDQMHRSRSYAALAMPWHLEHFLMAKVAGQDTGAAYFSLGRTARESAFVAADKAVIGRHVVAHLARSFTLQREVAAIRGANALLSAVIDQAPTGIVLFDIGGRPVLVNQKAADIFARGDGLALANGQLRAEAVTAQARLALALEAVIAIARGEVLPPPSPVCVTRRDGSQPYRVMFSLLKPLDGGNLVPGAVVVALIHDERRAAGPGVTTAFRATYGLTRAEVSLCTALLAGQSLTEAAVALGVKRNTAKTHLARIFDKTGVRSQVALLRLLALGSRP